MARSGPANDNCLKDEEGCLKPAFHLRIFGFIPAGPPGANTTFGKREIT